MGTKATAMDGVLSQFANLDSTTRWWLVVAVALTVFYAVMRPIRKKKDPLSRPPRSPGLAEERAVQRDMTNLLVELSEMARQVTAQLDTRTLKLEMLIKDADERIAEMKALTARSGTPPVFSAPPAASPMPVMFAPAAPLDSRHQDVYQLADQHLSTEQIAIKLSRPRGEIELILALRVPTTDSARLAELRLVEARVSAPSPLRLAQEDHLSVDLDAPNKPRRKKKAADKTRMSEENETEAETMLQQRDVG